MPGLLTHLVVAIISFGLVHLIHFKLEYSWAIFAGNFLPDIIRQGLSAVKQGTFEVLNVQKDSFYHLLSSATSSYVLWFGLGFFVLGTTATLYHFHYIGKKKMEEYDELYLFLIIGIFTHLLMDILIIEKDVWI